MVTKPDYTAAPCKDDASFGASARHQDEEVQDGKWVPNPDDEVNIGRVQDSGLRRKHGEGLRAHHPGDLVVHRAAVDVVAGESDDSGDDVFELTGMRSVSSDDGSGVFSNAEK